ncbi:HpcH/HpaI aldolase family protein [Staphylococcus lutrae]|uniref:Siderophore biosynthesis protein SbnG n=1 Tax=Staphylococcus lutrae TaxID=155085 RepID=A0AAC9WJK6_9STAP|nr:HpcH/HpaI aldolase/citrate lyase family protein [Staphylococcus lutrae]ARJ51183.1 siderophore biosynthesis protein SbnG [Staphylococcus lutrae]PNZ39428.1 siderophore biosynthesis protein SbnG [Staphylococcus lutrae]
MSVLSLKANLELGKMQYGLMNAIPDPLVVELIAASGYDFVVIDTEHVAIDDGTLAHMIRAAETAQIIPIVRVSASIERDIIKVLDMGAKGIIIPHVKDRATAERVVALSRYYPQGMRSLNGGRVAQFGKIPLTTAMTQSNASIIVIAMIEDMEGVAQIEDIVQVDGLDMIIEGAADLSQSIGLPWQTRHEDVQCAIQKIYQATKAAGKYFCALPRDEAQVKQWRNQGVQCLLMGDDRGKIYRHLQQDLAQMKEVNRDDNA